MKTVLCLFASCALTMCATLTPDQLHNAAQDAHQAIQDAKMIRELVKGTRGTGERL
jgi:hypothetical protein